MAKKCEKPDRASGRNTLFYWKKQLCPKIHNVSYRSRPNFWHFWPFWPFFQKKNEILHRSEATRPSARIGIFQTVSQTVSQDSQRSRRQRHPKLRAPDHQKTPTDHHKMQSRWNHSQILSGFWLRWMRKVRRRARAARSHKLLKLRRARGFSFFRL